MPRGPSCCRVVTHELRTPLSVVRVYVDLLAEAASPGRRPHAGRPPTGGDAALDQLGPARPAGRLDPGVGPRRGADRPVAGAVRRGRGGRRDRRDAAAPAPAAPDPLGPAGRADRRDRRRDALPPGARAAPRERVEVRADAPTGVSIGVWRLGDEIQVYVTDDGPGVPRRGLGERLRAVRADRAAAAGAAAPASACSPPAG